MAELDITSPVPQRYQQWAFNRDQTELSCLTSALDKLGRETRKRIPETQLCVDIVSITSRLINTVKEALTNITLKTDPQGIKLNNRIGCYGNCQ